MHAARPKRSPNEPRSSAWRANGRAERAAWCCVVPPMCGTIWRVPLSLECCPCSQCNRTSPSLKWVFNSRPPPPRRRMILRPGSLPIHRLNARFETRLKIDKNTFIHHINTQQPLTKPPTWLTAPAQTAALEPAAAVPPAAAALASTKTVVVVLSVIVLGSNRSSHSFGTNVCCTSVRYLALGKKYPYDDQSSVALDHCHQDPSK